MDTSRLLSGLSRITSPGRRLIPQIDGLRFIAIAAVILYHLRGYVESRASAPWPPHSGSNLVRLLTAHGHAGVQLFFAISGFILALPFATSRLNGAKPPSLKAYFLRRLTRLEPPYVLSMLVLFFIMSALQGGWGYTPHLWAGLVYQHNLIFGYPNVLNNVYWSLEVEIQFYLLAPLIATVFSIRQRMLRRCTIAAIATSALIVKAFLVPPGSWLFSTLLCHVEYFLAGFLLADVYVADWREAPAPSGAWDLVSAAGWPALFAIWDLPAISFYAFPALIVLLYMAALRGRATRALLGNRWLAAMGGMCYSLYLLHCPIIVSIGSSTARLSLTQRFDVNFGLQALLLLPITLVIGAAFYLLVERPCMNPNWPSLLASRLRDLVRRRFAGQLRRSA